MTASISKDTVGGAMEGPIATWYAAMTRSRQKEFDAAARALQAVVPSGAVLEVAPGPGYLAIRLAQTGRYTVTGLDISRSFVRIARENAAQAGVTVDFQHGSASRMPFADNQFDGLVCQAAFKNFGDPLRALNEMHRVLRPGGTALILDMRGDATSAELNQAAAETTPSRLNQWLVRTIFKYSLVRRAYTPDSFRQLAAQSAFGGGEIATDLIGMTITLRK